MHTYPHQCEKWLPPLLAGEGWNQCSEQHELTNIRHPGECRGLVTLALDAFANEIESRWAPAFAHCCPGKFFGNLADDKMLAQHSISRGRHSRESGNDVKQKWGVVLNSSHLPDKSDEIEVFAMLSLTCKIFLGQQWAFAGVTDLGMHEALAGSGF